MYYNHTFNVSDYKNGLVFINIIETMMNNESQPVLVYFLDDLLRANETYTY